MSRVSRSFLTVPQMNPTRVINFLPWILFYGAAIIEMASAEGSQKDDDFDIEDLIDRTTRKLKPVKEVIEDHMPKDFPKIRDCGPDETQNWVEPDPLDCAGYFLCDGKFYVHRTCSQSLLFDIKTHSCNWEAEVDCDDRAKPWTLPEYIGPHDVHQHYDIYQYTITNKKKLEKPKTHYNLNQNKSRWTPFDEIEVEDDVSYEYSM